MKWHKAREIARDIYRAYRAFGKDGGNENAAAVAYYMALSFFPLLLVGISVGGVLLRESGRGRDARSELLQVMSTQIAPQFANQIEAVLDSVESQAARSGPLGLGLLLIGAMAVFAQFEKAFDRIWHTGDPERSGFLAVIVSALWGRLRAFVLLLGLGIFIVLGFVATMGLSAVLTYSRNWLPIPPLLVQLATTTAAVGLNALLFAALYKALPKRHVQWQEAAGGALLASLLWEGGRRILAGLVIASKYDVYGVVGAFIAVMLWVYYAVSVVLLGAEFVQQTCCRNREKRESSAAGSADYRKPPWGPDTRRP